MSEAAWLFTRADCSLPEDFSSAGCLSEGLIVISEMF